MIRSAIRKISRSIICNSEEQTLLFDFERKEGVDYVALREEAADWYSVSASLVKEKHVPVFLNQLRKELSKEQIKKDYPNAYKNIRFDA